MLQDVRLRTLVAAAMVLGAIAVSSVGVAQGRYSTVLRVNDKIITGYEIDQRMALLSALGAPGDLRSEAVDRLIDERLQAQAAEELGLSASEQQVREGLAEFASRANTTPEGFVATLVRRGVSEASVLNFIEAGVLWRTVVRVRFAGRANVTDEDVDRAILRSAQGGGARVLISEIVLPARTPEETASAENLMRDIQRVNGFEAFAAAARNFSAAPSRERGGRIDWTDLSDLPPALRSQLLTMSPGQLTAPLKVQNVIAIFQLRALQEIPPTAPRVESIDFAQLLFPGGSAADARAVAGRIDTCDDLYGVARKRPPEHLIRDTRAPSTIPGDFARELELLDPNEVSTRLTRGGVPVLLMLCARTVAAGEELDRDAIRRQLGNAQIAALADQYLGQLRANAVIIDTRG